MEPRVSIVGVGWAGFAPKTLGYTTGRYDILVLVKMLFRDDERLFHFLEEELPSLHGIVSTETSHVLHAEKINYDWKLPSEFGPGRADSLDMAGSDTRPATTDPNGRRPSVGAR